MEKILSLKDRIHAIQTSVALKNSRELDFNPDSSIYFSGSYTLAETVKKWQSESTLTGSYSR